jgi:hypothetical protein
MAPGLREIMQEDQIIGFQPLNNIGGQRVGLLHGLGIGLEPDPFQNVPKVGAQGLVIQAEGQMGMRLN